MNLLRRLFRRRVDLSVRKRLRAEYETARRRHNPSRAIWLELREAANAELRAGLGRR